MFNRTTKERAYVLNNYRGVYPPLYFIIGFVCLIYLSLLSYKTQEKINNREIYSSLYAKAREFKILYPRVFIAQTILETANRNSKIYLENKNVAGLKVPKYRKTTSIGERYGHAVFSDYRDSYIDYQYRQEYWMPIFTKNYYPIESEEDYLNFLIKTHYAEDPLYKEKLVKIINSRLYYLSSDK